MASVCPAGFFNGVVRDAWTELDDRGDLWCYWQVVIGEHEPLDCRHATSGERAAKTQAICESLGIAWMDGLVDIQTLSVGKTVRVNVVHKPKSSGDGFWVNAYVVVGGASGTPRKRASIDQVRAHIEKAQGQSGDGLPF